MRRIAKIIKSQQPSDFTAYSIKNTCPFCDNGYFTHEERRHVWCPFCEGRFDNVIALKNELAAAIEKRDIEFLKIVREYLPFNYYSLVIDEILGLVRQSICSVQDTDGNHCPEAPIVTFDFYGKTLQLCERCLSNAKDGAYGDEIAEAAKSAQQVVASELLPPGADEETL